MATQTSATGGDKRKRTLSKKQRRMYRRRRIVAGIIVALIIALVVFCVYSLGRGAVALGQWVIEGTPSVEREEVPTPTETTGVKDCTSTEVTLQLTADAASVSVGGSLDFSASITYTGSASCLINAADDNRVLTITSGSDEVWRSDSCPVDDRMLLMAQGDVDTQTITWNTNRTGSECEDDSDLESISAGTYIAQLSLADIDDVFSDEVTIVVQ